MLTGLLSELYGEWDNTVIRKCVSMNYLTVFGKDGGISDWVKLSLKYHKSIVTENLALNIPHLIKEYNWNECFIIINVLV